MNLDNERRALGIVVFSLGVSSFVVDTSDVSFWNGLIVGLALLFVGLELLDIKD